MGQRQRRIVAAMDSFKGSISSAQAGAAVARGVLSADPSALVRVITTADGGEGTLEALAAVEGAGREKITAIDLLGRPLMAEYVVLTDCIVIESASVMGLPLLPHTPDGKPESTAPRVATSLGLGLLARAVVDKHRPRRLVIGLGGTGCTDGGAGLIIGLGGKVLDAEGQPVGSLGGNPILRGACGVELPDLDGLELIGLTDVAAPLTGPDGAAHTFAAQKGADLVTIDELEDGLATWGQVLGAEVAAVPGAGAAGGIGAALAAMGGELRSGVEWILEVAAPGAFEHVDLVFTGEGRIDSQSSMGKVPHGVARMARRHGAVTVIALAGSVDPDANVPGIDAVFPIHTSPLALVEAMDPATTARGLEHAARQLTALTRATGRW